MQKDRNTLAYWRRSPLKQFVRSTLMMPRVNRVAVRLIAALPETEWKRRIQVVGNEGVLDLGGYGSVRMGHGEKCQIARQLHWGKGQLPDAADRLALSAALAFARTAEAFLDIGAYSGIFALAAARMNTASKSYAYEILPENFLILYENAMRNNLVMRCIPRLCGISDQAGSMTVPVATGLGTLPSSVSLAWKFDDGIEVPVQTLDSLHDDLSGPVVIKIDVEGFEFEVLNGGRDLLARTRPDIICEILESAPRIADIEGLLKSLGATFYQITENGFIARERIVPRKRERDWLLTWKDPNALSALGLPLI
jgi:FkbM family methyltransferase